MMLPNPIGSIALFCGHSRSAPTIGVATTPIYSPLVRSNQAWGRAAAAHTTSEANEVQRKVSRSMVFDARAAQPPSCSPFQLAKLAPD